MKQTDFTRAVDKMTKIKMRALDIILAEMIQPIEDVGNPEKLLGKTYDQWTGEDFQLMIKIYGQGDDTPLSNLVFRKEYEKVKELEAEEAEQ